MARERTPRRRGRSHGRRRGRSHGRRRGRSYGACDSMHLLPTVFGELALLALAGVVVTLLLRQVRLPPVAGLLVTGALVGPFGLSLVGGHGRIELLAEVGVVLLLFSIGLEFSLERLRAIGRVVVVGGSLQVGLTIAAVVAAAKWMGFSTGVALLVGFVFALSSTAIVLRALGERGESDAPHGRFIIGVLIFQDLAVIGMMLVVPVLAGEAASGAVQALALALGKAVAVIVGAVVAARWVLPKLLRRVDASRSREVFGLALVGVCLGTAWVTSAIGLSLALGAFIAGVVIADTDFSNRALSDVVPLRDVLTSLFFMSMGMLFDLRVVLANPLAVLGLLLAFVVGKGLIAAIAAMVMRFPARVAWLAGAALAQFGEFGFVLAKEAERHGLVSAAELGPLLAAGLISMFVTRLVVSAAPRFAAGDVILKPLERLLRVQSIDEPLVADRDIRDHVIIVGYGPGGRHVAQRLQERQIPYLVLDLNANTVRAERAGGARIYYGDITSPEAQEHAHIDVARAVVLMISDPDAVRRAVSAIRASGAAAPLFVRARFVAECAELVRLGADEVVAEELQASRGLVERLLARLGP